MSLTKKQFQDALLKEKKATRKELDEFGAEAKKSSRSLEEILIEKKIFDENSLAAFKAKAGGIPEADLSGLIDPSVLEIVPETMAKSLGVLPIQRSSDEIIVAMAEPDDLGAVEFIKKRTGGLKVVRQYASPDAIARALETIKSGAVVVPSEVAGEIGEANPEIGPSVIRLVDSVIQNAIKAKASDIHIEPQEQDLFIRYRVDGILRDVMKLSKSLAPAVIARVKVMANLKLDEHRLPQDGRFKKEYDKRKFSFRISIMPVFDGEKAAIRILEEDIKIMDLKELGFLPEQAAIIERQIKKPFGMVLATGPTGSGKTTTLYTLLQMLNTREVNISSVEDPIEYRMPGTNQTQVKPEIGLTFANGLRSILRQDPNIIMVGEVRDNETASLAINAALTGHLVLSTLHTNNAAGALPRLLDMHVEGFLISSTVNAIIAQRLVRSLHPSARQPYKLTVDEVAELGKSINLMGIVDVFRERGLLESGQTFQDITWYRSMPTPEYPEGYHGRTAIREVLEVDDSIRTLIFKGASADEIAAVAREEGKMLTMQEAGLLAAAEGLTSIEEVLRVTKD